jgi:hypothetical protein
MNQSIWCQQHGRWHDVTNSDEGAVRAPHLHVLTCVVSRERGDFVECAVCGGRWGAA